jgi:hypothetical protein
MTSSGISFYDGVGRSCCDIRLGAKHSARGWAGKYAKRRHVHLRLLRYLVSPVFSLVRAAGIGSPPDSEFVARRPSRRLRRLKK